MSENHQYIRVERRGPIAEVVLNRPDKLNAMPFELFYEIRTAFEEYRNGTFIKTGADIR